MTATRKGWTVFLAALGMLLAELALDIRSLDSWATMTSPTFVSSAMIHVAAVIGAFVGGKLIPNPAVEQEPLP